MKAPVNNYFFTFIAGIPDLKAPTSKGCITGVRVAPFRTRHSPFGMSRVVYKDLSFFLILGCFYFFLVIRESVGQ